MVDEHTLILLHFDNSLIENSGNLKSVTIGTGGAICRLATGQETPKFGTSCARIRTGSSAYNGVYIWSGFPSLNIYTIEGWVTTPPPAQDSGEGAVLFHSGEVPRGSGSTILEGPSLQIDPYGSSERYLKLYIGYASSAHNYGGRIENPTGWYHIACSCDGSTTRCFINGTLKATAPASRIWNRLHLGAGSNNSYYMSDALYDEIRVSDICRYTEDFTPPTAPFGNPMGLIKSTQPVNLLDKTSITGITSTGIEPANTSRRLVFQVDGTWNKLTADGAGAATLTPVTTQDLTVDSVLSEGNTVAELDAITSIPGFAGKLVYPAAALFASADASVMPTLGLTIEGLIDTTVNVYEYTDYSQEYVLGDSDVTIVSAVAETTTTGSGAVTITARLYQNGEWSEYMPLNAVQMQQASKIQLKALYTVQTTSGADSVHIDAVTITYNTAGAVVSGATTDIVTVTERFENDLAYVHAYAKHERLVDAEIEAYCSLRKQPHQRAMYQVGNGTGALATYQLPDTGVNQDTLQVYVDGKPNYDFGYNTETSQITVTADLGAVVSASYEYGWEPSTWVQMTKGSTQINDSGLCTTEYTYVIPTHSETYTVTAVKYSLVRPEGTVTNETIGVGTGKRQIIQLPHYAKTETIVCNGSWSYDYDSKRLTIIAPEGEDIVISYDWIAETPHVYGIAAGWAETIE